MSGQTGVRNPKKKRTVLLVDCQSFYASVEKAIRPQYADRPVVVAGDPERRTGIILAACPIAKQYGIVTGEALAEALRKCPQAVVIRPRMAEYIRVSMQITNILEQFSDLVEPYSIDEQFVDITGSLGLLGDPWTIAVRIQERIRQETGVYARIGISENKVLAKMACDLFAKKRAEGIYELSRDKISEQLWPQPVHGMFMVGSRMTRHLARMGIYTIGDLARYPLQRLRKRWGINGEVLWRIANGYDDSPLSPDTHLKQKAIGHQMTLPRDYVEREELETVLLELCELVCRRARQKGVMGRVVSVGCQGADFDFPQGFWRQMTIAEPTHVTNQVYRAAKELFFRHWDGFAVRKIGAALSGLSSDRIYQLALFDDRERFEALEKATDRIKDKYGEAAILRAVSLTRGGQAIDRSQKIGGHYK